jgi:hypothetical protein
MSKKQDKYIFYFYINPKNLKFFNLQKIYC